MIGMDAARVGEFAGRGDLETLGAFGSVDRFDDDSTEGLSNRRRGCARWLGHHFHCKGFAQRNAVRSIDMWSTCKYAGYMSKMIQIRNVPDALHRKLKSRAALEGVSLSDLLLREIEQLAERPTVKELAERLARRATVKYKISPAEILREERNRR